MSDTGNCNNQDCVKVNTSASVGECLSTPAPAITVPNGTARIKVPLVLSEITVDTNLVANIHFPDPVLEIKDIKKRIKIVQCRLLLPGIPATTNTGVIFPPVAGTPIRLFLKGFVRKNIQYATPLAGTNSARCVSSELRSLTVDVPFECVTTLGTPTNPFLNPPQLPFLNTRSEFDFFRAQNLGEGFPEKDQLLSSDLSQFHQVSSQFYNELPFCELISSNIVEWDESVDRMPLPGNKPFEEGTFRNIVEKMFLQFTVKVLQYQQINITTNA